MRSKDFKGLFIVVFSLISFVGSKAETESQRARLDSLYIQTWELLAQDPLQALDSARSYYELARSLQDTTEMGHALDFVATAYLYQNQNDSAYYLHKQALQLFERTQDTFGLSKVHVNLGTAELYRGNFIQSLRHYRRSYHLDTLHGDESGPLFYHYNLATLYRQEQAQDRALYHFWEALQITLEDSLHLYQLPGLYISIAEIRAEQGDLEAAWDTATIAEQHAHKYEENLTLASVHSVYSQIARKRGEFEKSLQYLDTVYHYDTIFGDPYSLAYTWEAYALTHLAMGQKSKALEMIRRAQKIADNEQTILLERDIYQSLARILDSNRLHKQAYSALRKYLNIRDSLRPVDIHQEVLQLDQQVAEKKLDLLQARKKLQDKELAYRNVQLYTSLGIALLALVVGLLLYRSRKRSHEFNRALLKQNQEIRQKQEKLNAVKSDLQEKNNKLEKLNRSKDRLFSIMAHDLKQPFHQLQSSIELIQQNQFSAEDRQQLLLQLHESVQRTSEMVNNLLTWSKAQFAGITIQREPVNLSAVTKKQVLQFSNILDKKQLQVQLDIDFELTVYADAEHLAVIIRNLIHNAIKFSHSTSTLEISGRQRDENYLSLTVRDYGVGMDKRTLERLKQSPGNGNESKMGTFQEEGAGLGLLIIKEFLRENGGALEIDSTPEEGSAFTIIMEVARSEKAQRGQTDMSSSNLL